MHDRGFCCHGDINSRLPAQTHNWVRIERWRGAVKIPLMKVEHQSCCRRLQSTHNQMKCLAERKRHNGTGFPALPKLMEQLRMSRKTTQHIFFCFCFSFLFFLSNKSLVFGFWRIFFFWYSKLVLVHLALILLFQAWIYPQSLHPLPPQMMEINSHKRSGPLWQAEPPARGSSAPFERQTKAKDFCPLCLLLKIPLKICSCLLQSAPQFFYWCSVFFLFFFFGSRGGGELTRGCARLEQCAGRERCRSPG